MGGSLRKVVFFIYENIMIFKKKSQTLFFLFLQKILGVALGGLEMGQYWDSTETVLRQY